MKKTHKVLLLMFGVIVLAVAGFKAMQPKEPEYQGRKLSEWIADLNEPPPKNLEATKVVKKIPELVLPFVEQRLFKNRDPRREFLPVLQRYIRGIHDRMLGERNTKAYQWRVDFEVLRVLGTNAFPVLERLMLNSESNYEACRLLAELDAVELLQKNAQKSSSDWVRCEAVTALGEVTGRKNDARKMLLQLTHDPDWIITLRSVDALEKLDTPSDVMVPRLCELIDKGDEDTKLYLISLLGKYGVDAVPAVPLLEKIRATASNSLYEVSQETLGRIVVKTSP